MAETELETEMFVLPKPLWEMPTIPSLQIGAVSIPTYPMMIGVGALAMLVCIWRRRNRFDFSGWKCIVFTILLTLCGVAGAKLLYMLENLPDSLKSSLTGGGVSFFGSVYLIPLVMPLVGRMFGLKATQTNDLCAPCIAVMVGFIRVGCLLCGCCGGRVAYVGNYYFTWPTQILESIGDFIIFFWLLRVEQREERRDILYPLFMLSYSALRFFVEFLRYSPKKLLSISNGHWFTMIAVVAALLWMNAHKHRNAAINEPKDR